MSSRGLKAKGLLRKIALAAAVGLSSMVSFQGCGAPTQETEFIDVLKKKHGATQEEAEAAFVMAFRKEHGRIVERDGKAVVVPNYESVTIDERMRVARRMRSDLDELLGFDNPSNTGMVDAFGIRPVLEQRRAAVSFNLARLEQAKLYEGFKAAMSGMMGPAPFQDDLAGGAACFGNRITEMDLNVPDGALESKLVFDAPYVDGARSSKQLVVIESIDYKNVFSVEEPNPEYPDKDPTHATRWVEKDLAVRVIGYDVGGNGSRSLKYVEVFRLGKDGSSERVPAMKIFHPVDSDAVRVVVMDSDPQGKAGNGQYDRLEMVLIDSAREIITDYEKLLRGLYRDGEEKRRERPVVSPMDVQIVRAGDVDPQNGLWEMNKGGWEVPIHYQIPPAGLNYRLAVCFKKPDGKPILGPSPYGPGQPRPREIKFVAKEYLNPASPTSRMDGRVVEFFRVKDAYRMVLGADVDGRRLTLEFPDGRVETSLDSRVLEAVPYAKAYDQGDASRFLILDKDGKAEPRYELRREFTPKPASLDLERDTEDKP